MKAEEFKKKVLPLYRKIYPFAFRILHNREEAEDTVQDIFVKLWDMKDELHTIRNIEAFSMTMTKNSCFDRLKKKRTLSIDEDERKELAGRSDISPEDEMEVKDAVSIVRQTINNLPEQQRLIMQLRDIDGYSNNEIIEIMEINENTLRVNLSRARKKVRENLLKNYNYGSQENRGSFTKVL